MTTGKTLPTGIVRPSGGMNTRILPAGRRHGLLRFTKTTGQGKIGPTRSGQSVLFKCAFDAADCPDMRRGQPPKIDMQRTKGSCMVCRYTGTLSKNSADCHTMWPPAADHIHCTVFSPVCQGGLAAFWGWQGRQVRGKGKNVPAGGARLRSVPLRHGKTCRLPCISP